MYLPECGFCHGDGFVNDDYAAACHECGGKGLARNHWIKCDQETYHRAIKAAGGIRGLTVLSGYTRIDGDELGTGTDIRTTWGKPDGTPVGHSERRGRIMDDPEMTFAWWVWEP